LPDPPVFQPAPLPRPNNRVLLPPNFHLPLRPMPQPLARNFLPLPEPAQPGGCSSPAPSSCLAGSGCGSA
jgi:hypothetical protein